jgi:hypothetical protein
MKVIQGGFKKGSWLHDRDAYSNEEIALPVRLSNLSVRFFPNSPCSSYT